jgi:hypothetical protein
VAWTRLTDGRSQSSRGPSPPAPPILTHPQSTSGGFSHNVAEFRRDDDEVNLSDGMDRERGDHLFPFFRVGGNTGRQRFRRTTDRSEAAGHEMIL